MKKKYAALLPNIYIYAALRTSNYLKRYSIPLLLIPTPRDPIITLRLINTGLNREITSLKSTVMLTSLLMEDGVWEQLVAILRVFSLQLRRGNLRGATIHLWLKLVPCIKLCCSRLTVDFKTSPLRVIVRRSSRPSTKLAGTLDLIWGIL
jgi:hypothetical protein